MTPPFPADALRDFARSLVTDEQPDAYSRYRAACDAVILGVEPSIPQHRFATALGISRTTLRAMLARCGISRNDGRRAVPS